MNILKTHKTIFFAANTAATVLSAANTADAASVAGFWYDHTGRSAIQVSKCGSGLCGRIVWLKNKSHNSVCGTAIIGGGKRVGNSYDTGWIYSPERRKKYSVEITPQGNSLKVMGYAGSKFLSKTMIWKRAPSNLKRCA
jgi:uncharacterized protein (DUF2147 family)